MCAWKPNAFFIVHNLIFFPQDMSQEVGVLYAYPNVESKWQQKSPINDKCKNLTKPLFHSLMWMLPIYWLALLVWKISS